jgi:3-oxoacyl-ACP reductase-like protein
LKSVEELVGGKSTLQNEILGDLQQEVSSAPEKGEELPLEELGAALGTGLNGALGKYSAGPISRLVSGKMLGGFNSSTIKAHLSKSWGLGPSRADGVLLLATTLEPPKRLASEAEAKSWLDGVVTTYAQRSGISLSAPGAGGASGGGAAVSTINSEEFLIFQADQEKFAAQHVERYMRYLNRDSRAGEYECVVRSLHKGPETRTRVGTRSRRSSSQFLRPQVASVTSVSADRIPLLHLKRKVGNTWEYSSNLIGVYSDILHEIATSGTTFKDKNALLTGVGKGSIGVEVVKGLLSGGAHVVITTSRYNRKTVEYYQSIFQTFGSHGSALTVVLFNQASKQDVEALVDYIFANLGMDLDDILPFAGIPENGREIDGLDDRSELAHRMMLVNLLRILGAVKNKKASRHFVTRPTQVILPLSPNHGLFGKDGLYSESKISLETLFQRWASESWGEYLCLADAVIG